MGEDGERRREAGGGQGGDGNTRTKLKEERGGKERGSERDYNMEAAAGGAYMRRVRARPHPRINAQCGAPRETRVMFPFDRETYTFVRVRAPLSLTSSTITLEHYDSRTNYRTSERIAELAAENLARSPKTRRLAPSVSLVLLFARVLFRCIRADIHDQAVFLARLCDYRIALHGPRSRWIRLRNVE